MKRVCCYCERVYGHKCRSCGNDNAALLSSQGDQWRDASRLLLEGWLECLVCAHKWPAENDGVTHGICAECFEKHKPQSGEPAGGGPVGDATGEP